MLKKFFYTWSILMIIIIIESFLFNEKAKASTYTEDFDSYSTGQLSGQGSWESGTGDQSQIGVVNSNSYSAPNSIAPNGANTVNTFFEVATSTNLIASAEYYLYKPDSGESMRVGIYDSITNLIAAVVVNSSETIEIQRATGGFVSTGSTISHSTYTRIKFEIEEISTGVMEYNVYNNGSLVYTATTTHSRNDIKYFGVQKIAALSSTNRLDSMTFLTDDDVNPVSRVILDTPVNENIYAFNTVPFSGTYNNLETYNYIVFDLNKISSPQANVYVPPYELLPTTVINQDWEFNKTFNQLGEYTLRARLYDSVNNLYTDWSDPKTFSVGSTSTPPVEDYNVGSSTFATSTALDSGNLLSYINIPQLLSTKAPFGYFFQAYSIVTNSISNPPTASTFGNGSFDISIAGSTTTVEMFSTSTVSYFLTPNVIAPIRAILVAILYMLTLFTIYQIVRHSHLL